jgi:aspartate/methionine/tyrosine aminotransferase
VQTKAELEAIIDIANKRNLIVINNSTHGFHRLNQSARHYPMVSLRHKDLRNVLSTAGLSHGFGLAGLRIGFLGGRPELVSAVLAVKSSITRINMNMPIQSAALAALKDRAYPARCAALLKKNLRLLDEVVSSQPRLRFMARPDYGFFACVDTSGIKASCQELTVALLKRRCAVYPGDGLGETSPISYLRLNFSTPRKEHFRWLKEALPGAIKEAESGMYRRAVVDFFKSVGTPRAGRIVKLINGIR